MATAIRSICPGQAFGAESLVSEFEGGKRYPSVSVGDLDILPEVVFEVGSMVLCVGGIVLFLSLTLSSERRYLLTSADLMIPYKTVVILRGSV